MVPRYSRPAMVAIWDPEARYRIWFEIEAHATDKLGALGRSSGERGQGAVGLVGHESPDRRCRDRRRRGGDEA